MQTQIIVNTLAKFAKNVPNVKPILPHPASGVCWAQGWRNRGARGAMAPPKNLSGWAKVCFGPPKILTTGPQTLCQIASENHEMCKIFKIFRLPRANTGKTYSSGDFMLFQSKFLYLVIFFSTESNEFNNNLRS